MRCTSAYVKEIYIYIALCGARGSFVKSDKVPRVMSLVENKKKLEKKCLPGKNVLKCLIELAV